MSRYLYNMNGSGENGDNVFRHDSHSKPDPSVPQPDPVVDENFSRELRQAIAGTRQFFFNHQHPDGYWVAELEGDSQFQSETILLLAFLGEENSELGVQCARHLLDSQKDDGGWGRFADGESDVNHTVKAYFALKLAGYDPSDEAMNRARIRALELGGIDALDGISRFFLAILGQVPYDTCSSVPAPSLLFSSWSPFDIYSYSAWARPILVPMSVVATLTPVRPLPVEKGIRELFAHSFSSTPFDTNTPLTFSPQFCKSGLRFRLANVLQRCGLLPFQQNGLKKAEQWILEHCRNSDGPGAAFGPIVWSLIALKALGYQDDSEEIRFCREQLRDLAIVDKNGEKARIQPCRSPVRDTSLTLKALLDSGLTAAHPAVRKGLQWIQSRRIREKGDWSRTVDVKPGGWCFQFNNPFYPDCEDTAIALEVLAGRFDEARTAIPKIADRYRLSIGDGVGRDGADRSADEALGSLPPDLRLMVGENVESLEEARQNILDVVDVTLALKTGLHWLLAMQCRDGGWAAFDRTKNPPQSELQPVVADGSVWQIDSSTPDMTGRVLVTLGRLGFRVGQNAEVDRAVEFLKRQQQSDGSWIGRWGVNYIYGTWLSLAGLAAVGVSTKDPTMTAGAHWLSVHQHSSGGWGESPKSCDEPALRGHGKPTASQTAWALMGLLAAGKIDDPVVHRGVRFLLDRQRRDGTWHESEFTGTALPGVSYLKYHYYSVYFPLMALSAFATRTKVANVEVRDGEMILPMQKVRLFSPESECYNNARPEEPSEEFTLDEPPKPNTTQPKKPSPSRPRNNPPTLRLFLG